MDLLLLTDAHYAWLMAEGPPPADAPRLTPEGLASAEVIVLLRRVAAEVGGEASWMMVTDGEGVGIVSIKERDAAGRWDIGYGVAPSRRGRGHATAAVAALKLRAQALGARGLTAETLPVAGSDPAHETDPEIAASPRILRRNGFRCIGQHDHPEDGLVDQWLVEWEA